MRMFTFKRRISDRSNFKAIWIYLTKKNIFFSDLFDILPLRFDFAIFKNNQLFLFN